MTRGTSHRLFVNLAVRDLERSVDFFTRLGFRFDPRFRDEQAACLIVNEQACVMLLAQGRFRDFTQKELCDTHTHTEGLFAIGCASRGAVDALVEAALAAGGKQAMDPEDHGSMYGRSFYDPDGHHWEAFWMDPAIAGVG